MYNVDDAVIVKDDTFTLVSSSLVGMKGTIISINEGTRQKYKVRLKNQRVLDFYESELGLYKPVSKIK